MSGENDLKKAFIIRETKIVSNIRKKGKRFICGKFLIYRLANDLSTSRMVVAIRKSAGNSVTRNYAKRVVREFFRTHRLKMGSFDILFFAERKLTLGSQGWLDQIRQFEKICCS